MKCPKCGEELDAIKEFVLGDGIRIYLPSSDTGRQWRKAVKTMSILLEEEG